MEHIIVGSIRISISPFFTHLPGKDDEHIMAAPEVGSRAISGISEILIAP